MKKYAVAAALVASILGVFIQIHAHFKSRHYEAMKERDTQAVQELAERFSPGRISITCPQKDPTAIYFDCFGPELSKIDFATVSGIMMSVDVSQRLIRTLLRPDNSKSGRLIYLHAQLHTLRSGLFALKGIRAHNNIEKYFLASSVTAMIQSFVMLEDRFTDLLNQFSPGRETSQWRTVLAQYEKECLELYPVEMNQSKNWALPQTMTQLNVPVSSDPAESYQRILFF